MSRLNFRACIEPGTVLQGKYTIERTLGQGGMGAVYLAHMSKLGNKRVAIKEMTMAVADDEERRRAVQQFEKEAVMLAQLEHPGLVDVFDHFEEGGSWYLVMALVDGQTLEAIVDSQPPSVAQVLAWTDQVCDVLEYLHSRTPPVIFRDLKPNNIMLDVRGHIHLIDFGIARFFESSGATATFIRGAGTLGFSPIEQIGGGTTDPRSDIYSLGCTVYNLLTGVTPPNSSALICEEASLTPPRDLNPGISTELQDVVLKMMGLRKEQRYQTVTEVRQALRPIIPGPAAATVVPALGIADTQPAPAQGVETHISNKVCPKCGGMLPVGAGACPRCPSVPLPPTVRAPQPRQKSVNWLPMAGTLVVGAAAFALLASPRKPVPSPSPSASELPLGVQFTFTAVHEPPDLTVSPDGKRVAVLDVLADHSEAIVWDPTTGQQTVLSAGQPMESAILSPDGTALATLDPVPMNTVVFWNIDTRSSTPRFGFGDAGERRPIHLAFSGDGRRLATTGQHPRVWNLETGAAVREYDAPGDVALSADGKWALTTNMTTKLVLYRNVLTDQMTSMFRLMADHEPQTPNLVGFLPGKRAWCTPTAGSPGALLYCHPLEGGEEAQVTVPDATALVRPAVSPDGQWLASGLYRKDQTAWVYVWDTEDWKVRTSFAATGKVGAVAFLPDGRLVVSTFDQGKVTVAIHPLAPVATPR